MMLISRGMFPIRMLVMAALGWVSVPAGIGAETYYVAPGGSDARTGLGQWTNALLTIGHAIELAEHSDDVILVSNGTYNTTAALNIVRAVTLRGAYGRSQTFIVGDYTCRGLYINHSNATVEGFAISQFQDTRGGGVYLYAGTLLDCNISNCVSERGGGIFVRTGLISNCTVSACVSKSLGGDGIYAGGVHMDLPAGGAVLANSIIANCTNESSQYGAGVSSAAGNIVTGCTVVGNTIPNAAGGGIWSGGTTVDSLIVSNFAATGGGIALREGGSVAGCRILDNYATGISGGGVYVYTNALLQNSVISGNILSNASGAVTYGAGVILNRGGRMRNCLVEGNLLDCTLGGGAGVAIVRDAVVESCTIAGNHSRNTAIGGLYFYDLQGFRSIINTIIYSNTADVAGGNHNWNAADNKTFFTNCCTIPSVDAYGGGNITNYPEFAAPSTGDYRLQAQSLCVNSGLEQEWMAGGMDLDRRPRLDRFSRQADRGCYEYLCSGAMFNIK